MVDAGLQQARQHRAEIETVRGRLDAAEIVKPPDRAGRAEIEAGVAVGHVAIARVCGPEMLRVEMRKRVRDDRVDCRTRRIGVPQRGPQRHVTGMVEHGLVGLGVSGHG